MKRMRILVGVLVLGFTLISVTTAFTEESTVRKVNKLYDRVYKLIPHHRYIEAIMYAEQALSILEKSVGKEHKETGTCLYTLAMLHAEIGAYDMAELFYKRALDIYEKTLRPEHPYIVSILYNFAEYYVKTGAGDKAESLKKRALAIREKGVVPDQPEIARLLGTSALSEDISPQAADNVRIGTYDKADPLKKRTLDSREKGLGPDQTINTKSPRTIALSENVPSQTADDLYREIIRLLEQNRYGDAIPYAQRVLSIVEQGVGPWHKETAIALQVLAGLYDKTNAYDKAEPLYVRALANCERRLGPEHPDTLGIVYKLIPSYMKIKAFDKAEPLLRRLLASDEKTLGPDHHETAQTMSNLAALYQMMRTYDKAESLFRRSLAINEKLYGNEHPKTAASLKNLASAYEDMGSYNKAEPLFKRALAINENVYGPEHRETITALNNLAKLLTDMAAYVKAEPLYKRVLAVHEKKSGPEHQDTAVSLNNLANLYENMGAYGKAEPLYNRALAIKEKTVGPEHLSTANTLNNLASLYLYTGSYEKAEPLFRRSLAIHEKALGPEHPDTARAMNNLAAILARMAAYREAESLNLRALAVCEKALGPEHPRTALSLNNLAVYYITMGSYDKADPLFRRALNIYERVLGPEHPNTARALNNIAKIYIQIGDYDRAEPLVKRALDIQEKKLGPEHPDTANSLNVLAMFYSQINAYGKAEPLYRRVYEIRKKALGLDHPDTLASMNNFLQLYARVGLSDGTESLLKQILTMRKQALGPEHPETIKTESDLGDCYANIGEYRKGEALYKHALSVSEKKLGPEHPDTAIALEKMGLLYDRMGAFDRAVPLHQRVLAIREKALGEDHKDTATCLENLAMSQALRGQKEDALRLMERAQRIERRQIERIFGFASENVQTQSLIPLESDLYRYLSFIRQNFPANSKAVRNGLDVWLSRKGIILEAQKQIQNSVHADDENVQRGFEDLIQVRQRLARLVLEGPGKEGPADYQKRIADLTEQKESLEGRLSRLSQAFSRQKKTRTATTADIASFLPEGAALVEITRVSDFDFKKIKWGNSRYLAFVLPAGKGASVSLVDLGNGDDIDREIEVFRKSLRESRTSGAVLTKQSKDLYRKVFGPIRKALGDSKQIFLSPDGSLNLIPFELLMDDKGRYAIETHTFHYVAAGRDIAGFGTIKDKGKKAVLMGDPDFDLALSRTGEAKEAAITRSRQMQGVTFPRLPATKEEVEAIAAVLGRFILRRLHGKSGNGVGPDGKPITADSASGHPRFLPRRSGLVLRCGRQQTRCRAFRQRKKGRQETRPYRKSPAPLRPCARRGQPLSFPQRYDRGDSDGGEGRSSASTSGERISWSFPPARRERGT